MAPALSDPTAGLLTIAGLIGRLALAYVPVGALAAVLTRTRYSRFEWPVYRLLGVNPDGQQNARSYALAVAAFSLVAIVVLFAILVRPHALPFDRGLSRTSVTMALNTQLRRKLEEEPGRPRHFLTEPGVGYRFVP